LNQIKENLKSTKYKSLLNQVVKCLKTNKKMMMRIKA